MDQPPYHLDQIRRDAVLEAIQEVCVHRGWVVAEQGEAMSVFESHVL